MKRPDAATLFYVGVAAFLWAPVGALGGYAYKAGTSHSSASFVQPASPSGPQRAFPNVRVNWVGGGTFQVPSQAPPGSYIVATSDLTFGCSWQRLKADDDRLKSVIASGTVNRGGFDRFTVSPSDRVLKLIGDCTWARL